MHRLLHLILLLLVHIHLLLVLSWYSLVRVEPDRRLVWHHRLAIIIQSCENDLSLHKVRNLLIVPFRAECINASSTS